MVSINLNVEAYEPIHNEDNINTYLSADSDEDEETKWEFNTETTSLMATLHYAQDPVSPRPKPYPQNHRCRNCSTDEIYHKTIRRTIINEKNSVFRQNLGVKNEEIEGIVTDLHAYKYRKRHVLSVLSPVENLSQWEAVKAKVAPLRRETENVD